MGQGEVVDQANQLVDQKGVFEQRLGAQARVFEPAAHLGVTGLVGEFDRLEHLAAPRRAGGIRPRNLIQALLERLPVDNVPLMLDGLTHNRPRWCRPGSI